MRLKNILIGIILWMVILILTLNLFIGIIPRIGKTGSIIGILVALGLLAWKIVKYLSPEENRITAKEELNRK